jgi:hypothetical protein
MMEFINVKNFVSDKQQAGSFLHALWFPSRRTPPHKKPQNKTKQNK